jgi:hypothetical protein
MPQLNELIVAYREAIENDQSEPGAKANLDKRRKRLVSRVVELVDHSDGASGDSLLSSIRDLFVDVARRCQSWLPGNGRKAEREPEAVPSHLFFELGVLFVLQELAVRRAQNDFPTGSLVGISKDVPAMGALRVLATYGPMRRGELAVRLQRQKSLPSITKLCAKLTSAGVIVTTTAGKERIAHLTETGQRLLDHVAKRRGADLSDCTGLQQPTEILQLRNSALTITNGEFRPDEGSWKTDRTRFHLLLAFLYMADDLARQSRFDVSDRLFGSLLTRFVANDGKPTKPDWEMLDGYFDRDLTRQGLVECLFKYQVCKEEERKGLANEFNSIGQRLQPGTPLVLLWAPAAVNVAMWYSGHARGAAQFLRDRIYERAMELLTSLSAPVAAHWLAIVTLVRKPDDRERCISWWKQVEETTRGIRVGSTVSANVHGRNEIDAAINRCNMQLCDSARIDQYLVRFESELANSIKQWVVHEFPTAKDHFRAGGSEDWADEVALWSIENRDKLSGLLAKRRKDGVGEGLLAAAAKLYESVYAAKNSIHEGMWETPDFRTQTQRHIRQTSWILGRRQVDKDAADADMPEMRQMYKYYMLNCFWPPALVYLDICSHGEKP